MLLLGLAVVVVVGRCVPLVVGRGICARLSLRELALILGRSDFLARSFVGLVLVILVPSVSDSKE